MVEVKLGAATATRIEESYEPNFEAPKFFADWTPEVVKQHRDWLVSKHYAADSNFAVPLRRALHLPHRLQGRGLRAALQRKFLKGENR